MAIFKLNELITIQPVAQITTYSGVIGAAAWGNQMNNTIIANDNELHLMRLVA